MSEVRSIEVTADESDQRLDRWFRRRFPGLTHGRLEKMLRTGQVRVDGKRAKANLRLAAGQIVRVPPLEESAAAPQRVRAPRAVDPHEAKEIQSRVLYRDADVIVIDKPAGLSVQGGPGIQKHLDGLLDALCFDADERPRLVHRLDRDTSGVLALARHARAAAWLGEAFRKRTARKLYWAITVGVPSPRIGRIDLALEKVPGRHGEQMTAQEGGKDSLTEYEVLDEASMTAAWLKLLPHTGRTHQLRVHCAAIGTPILGDGKYGGAAAHMPSDAIASLLHLHARALELPKRGGGIVRAVAPLPRHMQDSFRFFGFEAGPNRVSAQDFDL